MSGALQIGSHAIRRDGEMWCLTDLWRAAGAPNDKRPAEFLRKEGRPFVEFLASTLDVAEGHIKKTRKIGGGGGETWTHWQIALAYAKWIDHAFHARVNEVYKAFASGQLSVRDPESIHLALRIQRLNAADYESAWDVELKLELARLRKVVGWRPGPGNGAEPRQLALAYGKTWRIILGDAIYDELKRRNPTPRDGSLHGQWIRDDRHRLIKREDMVLTLYIARRARRWADYEREMRAHFRRAPIQLPLGEP